MERIETMKTLLLSLAAVAALGAVAAPAAAQPYGDYGRYDHRYEHHGYGRLDTAYVDSLDWKITNAARHGVISWGEARSLRGDLRAVQPLAWRVQTGAARPWEVERLQRTVSRIEYAVNRQPRYDRDGRGYDRYDRGDGWR
jgi:opacity protein-like surface antigen